MLLAAVPAPPPITRVAARSKSWVYIGGHAIGQPAEFAKLAVVLMLGRHLSSRREAPETLREVIPCCMIAGVPALLVLAQKQGLIFAVTHNYSAYPMVRVARQMVQQGKLGEVRVVQAEYPQDWLAEPVEQTGKKQAAWRTDPAQAGGGAIGDIGSHAWHLADYVTGQPLAELCAELSSFVPGRPIDDNAQVMLRYAGGARGSIWASQVAPGHLNDLRLRVYGSKGGIEWRQELPNQLHYTPLGQPTQVLQRAGAAFGEAGARINRIPGGHPEGYLEAFASLYTEVAQHLRAFQAGRKPPKGSHFPTIADGLRGVQFIEAVQRSSAKGGRWVKLPAAQP